MSNTLQEEVTARLVAEYGFKVKGNRLTGGRCPACGQSEAYTPPDKPHIIICPRANKCGERTYARNLFPDLYNQFRRRHPPTKSDPHATARAYLNARGIDAERFKNCWKQGETTDPKNKSGPKFPTVQMTLSNGVAWHRLIDNREGRKNKVVASYSGHAWLPPDFQQTSEVWLVEAPLDALSLMQAGLNAVACISASHVPATLLDLLADTRTTLVIALDSDRAGQDGAKKQAAACKERGIPCKLAVPPEGLDWNDLLLRGDLAGASLEKTLEEALREGRLAQAENAEEYHKILREKWPESIFPFRGEYWSVTYNKGESSYFRVSDFVMVRRYRLQVLLDSKTVEYSEAVQVRHRDGEEHEVVLTGTQMAKPAAFREALFSRASVQWDGGAPELNRLLRKMRRRRVPNVRRIELWGFDRHSGADFFHDGAHGPDGKWYPVGDHGFVTIDRKSYSLPAVMEGEEFVWKSAAPGLDVPAFIALLQTAYPRNHALLALGFYAASLFAEQIAGGDKEKKSGLGFFPYLSLYGETDTGKSTLLTLLSRLLGRDWEGYPISNTNTMIGLARAISLYSNYPLVLTEADAVPDVDLGKIINLRHAYNRGAVRIVARKTHDNSIRATPFRATLVFGWNDEVWPADKVGAVARRTCSFKFLRADTGDESRAALFKLENIDPCRMAGFRHSIMESREKVLGTIITKIPDYSRWLLGEGIELERTAKNHAVPLAGFHAVLETFISDADRREELLEAACDYTKIAAAQKERSLKTDPDDVRHFLDQIDFLLRKGLENMARNGDVAFSLVQAESLAGEVRVPLRPDQKSIQRSLYYVKHNYPYNSTKLGKKVKCWVFRAEAFPSIAREQQSTT